MLRNFLVVLWRNLTRQAGYAIINVVGLATGLACSLIIILYAYGEWSYDRGFEQSDRIYRIGVSFFNIGKFASGPEQLLNVLPAEFPAVETATRIRKDADVLVRVGNQDFREVTYATDTAYFHIFHYAFLAGSQSSVLHGPREAVLTEPMARKYFGSVEAIGKTLEIGLSKEVYTVTGIVAKPNFLTHLNAGIFLSIQDKITGSPHWTSAAVYNYVLLKKNNSEADLKRALDKIIEKHVFPESGKAMGFSSLDVYKASDMALAFYVQPFRDIYLKSKLSMELTPGGNETNMYVFTGVSVFILILAAVNFVNLTTARASRRAREVGIRKTMGTSRGSLVIQFLLESIVTTTLAMLLSLLLSQIFIPAFEYVTGSPLAIRPWSGLDVISLYFLLSLIVGVLAGIYPAFYLTAFKPVHVLKGNTSVSGGQGFRNFLVVFQFSVSIMLIISTGVVVQQMKFMETTDLGFDQENIVTIDQGKWLGKSAAAFKTELSRLPGVTLASFHGGEPGSKRVMTFMTYETPEMTNPVSIQTYMGDVDYPTLMGFRLLKGRMFLPNMASDTNSFILNEAAVKTLNLGKNPIGATINKTGRVIGVVSDFHWESLRNPIGPVSIILSPSQFELGFKVASGAVPGFLTSAEKRWKELVPGELFKYHFVDGNFGDMVAKEKVFGKAIGFFTALAIFISCLGLFGLSSFTAEQRTKEIGIRKVLGAASSSIVLLLNKSITKLIIIAIVITVPVAAWIMSLWLKGFAYKIEPGIWTYLAPCLASLAIAWLTVTGHSVKAAMTDPAKTLRTE